MKSAKMSWRYIAGFVDGEGHVAVHPYDNTKYEGSHASKGLRAQVSVCQKTENKKVLGEISKFLTKHKIQHCTYDCKYVPQNHCMMSWLRVGHKTHLRKILKKILPYLIVKRKAAIKVLKFCERK